MSLHQERLKVEAICFSRDNEGFAQFERLGYRVIQQAVEDDALNNRMLVYCRFGCRCGWEGGFQYGISQEAIYNPEWRGTNVYEYLIACGELYKPHRSKSGFLHNPTVQDPPRAALRPSGAALMPSSDVLRKDIDYELVRQLMREQGALTDKSAYMRLLMDQAGFAASVFQQEYPPGPPREPPPPPKSRAQVLSDAVMETPQDAAPAPIAFPQLDL